MTISVNGSISTPNNGSDKDTITLRKSVNDSSHTVQCKDSTETTNIEGNPDPSFQIPRLQRQNTQEGIQSNIKESGQKLKQDVYSILFLEKAFSPSFFFAVFSISFQFVILGFLMYDLLQPNSSHNFLGVPAGVTVIVAIAQALGIVLSVLSCGDLIEALAFFDIIFHKEIFEIIPNATHYSWFFVWLLKFTEGCASVVITFIVLLKSENVLTLFQNFAALSFVFTIDDIFFELAKNGFFGNRITEGVFSTCVITLPKNATTRSIYIRNFSFYIILIAMLSSWGVIYNMQRNGHFICNHILAQFGDAYEPVTSRFSGHFRLETLRLHNRAVYTNRHDSHAEYPFIAYCESKNAWTLSLQNVTNENYDPCASPLALSPTTSTFDITTEGSSWLSIRRIDKRRKAIPYSSMKLECIDCTKGLNPSRDTCSSSGQCGDDGLCKCAEETYGLSCEYKAPCSTLLFTRLDEKWEFQIFRNEANELVLVQGKPVYFSSSSNQNRTEENAVIPNTPEDNGFLVIFFNGYRWVLTFSSYFDQFNITADGNIDSQWADYLTNKFHPYYSLYHGDLMSAPVPQSLPGDKLAPSNIAWYNVRFNKNLIHGQQGSVSSLAGNYKPMRCKENSNKYYDDDNFDDNFDV